MHLSLEQTLCHMANSLYSRIFSLFRQLSPFKPVGFHSHTKRNTSMLLSTTRNARLEQTSSLSYELSPTMQRYGGELIYHGRDEDGVLEVVDTYGIRALHFGTSPRQSALSLSNPQRLELAYIRAMLSPLLFIGEPSRVLLVGLGGGSLAKFLLEQFPTCRVEAVERRPGVVEIAHRYFSLPRSEHLTVHVADACEQVASLIQSHEQIFDLILVDAYDDWGMDPSVNAQDFLGGCARLIRPQGALAMNLWGTHPMALKQSTLLLRSCFPCNTLKLAVPNRGNIIGLGLGEALDPSKRKQLEPKAHELEIQLGLEMPYFLRNLRPL